jgi:hypothetical protein
MNGREIEFDWDEANVGHVARHRVLPDEAEQAVLKDPVDLGMEIVEREERYLNLGATLDGRVLLVVTTSASTATAGPYVARAQIRPDHSTRP